MIFLKTLIASKTIIIQYTIYRKKSNKFQEENYVQKCEKKGINYFLEN